MSQLLLLFSVDKKSKQFLTKYFVYGVGGNFALRQHNAENKMMAFSSHNCNKESRFYFTGLDGPCIGLHTPSDITHVLADMVVKWSFSHRRSILLVDDREVVRGRSGISVN